MLAPLRVIVPNNMLNACFRAYAEARVEISPGCRMEVHGGSEEDDRKEANFGSQVDGP